MKPSNRRKFLTTTSSAAAGLSMLTATDRVLGREKKSKIKIGQIGTGHAHARERLFAQLKQVTDDFELVGIVENDPERREKLAIGAEYQGVKVISEEQLLNTKRPAGGGGRDRGAGPVAHGQPLHRQRGCTSTSTSRPARTCKDFAALLIDTVRARRSVHLQMGYIYRYHTAFQWCYKAVAEGIARGRVRSSRGDEQEGG